MKPYPIKRARANGGTEANGPVSSAKAMAASVAGSASESSAATPEAPGHRALQALVAAMVSVGAMVAAFLVPMSASAPAAASASRSAAPVVAGDLIVKFRDASEPGVALAAVLAGTRTLGSAAPVAVRLSAETGVPLKLVQVTSGREALLAVDRDALLRSLAQRAAREPGVARAEPVVPAAPGLPSDLASVRLQLQPGAAPTGLADKLASGELLRPKLGRAADGATLLNLDVAALTLSLLERLKQHPDVEYAQANRLLRPVEPRSPR